MKVCGIDLLFRFMDFSVFKLSKKVDMHVCIPTSDLPLGRVQQNIEQGLERLKFGKIKVEAYSFYAAGNVTL